MKKFLTIALIILSLSLTTSIKAEETKTNQSNGNAKIGGGITLISVGSAIGGVVTGVTMMSSAMGRCNSRCKTKRDQYATAGLSLVGLSVIGGTGLIVMGAKERRKYKQNQKKIGGTSPKIEIDLVGGRSGKMGFSVSTSW